MTCSTFVTIITARRHSHITSLNFTSDNLPGTNNHHALPTTDENVDIIEGSENNEDFWIGYASLAACLVVLQMHVVTDEKDVVSLVLVSNYFGRLHIFCLNSRSVGSFEYFGRKVGF